MANGARSKTALVLAGGGSFGAIQAGMLHSLATHGIAADMVVGSSVGSLNGAYYAGNQRSKASSDWKRSGVDCAEATFFR